MDSLGGYRLVRKLGEGQRAEVFLGHPSRSGGESRPVAIKVFRQGVAEASIAAEVEALTRAAGEHTLALLDVTSGQDGALVLILGRVPGASLDRLLRERHALRLGEAITVLAPLALALRRIHLAGAVHGAVTREAVLFDAAGAPVLARFGRSFPITAGQPPALLDAVPGVQLDIAGFASVAGSVLGAVGGITAGPLADWVRSAPALEHAVWFEELADRLFDLGVPEPVDFEGDEPVVSRVPGRVLTAAPVPGDTEVVQHGLLVGLLPPDLAAVAAGLAARLRAALGTVRPRVWAIAGGVAVALVAAMLLVPQGGSGAVAGQGPTAVPSVAQTSAPDAGPVSGDDPVAAFVALLEARERCIRDLSVLCLDAVAQASSSALADDEALIRSLQAGAESPEPFTVSAADITIDERLGDSVILDVDGVADSEPASVLLMKGEAGWRIRDYLEE